MNLAKLKLAEAQFLSLYPEGFDDPGLEQIAKRHRIDKMVAFAQQSFGADCYSHVDRTVENMVKTISRSSMVSMFEKPKFKDFVGRLDQHQKAFMVDCLIEFLHGEQKAGFAGLVELLALEKIAKWSLLTIIPAYYAPSKEVFVKPTTAKGVIRHFEVADLVYKPAATWEFYSAYRKLLNQAKQQVDKKLYPSNAAFSGFLMMSL